MFNKKLNLTIGVYNFHYSQMFDKLESGEVVPALSSLRDLLATIGKFGNFNVKLKTPAVDILGEANENGFQTGVLGMLQNKEVDACFLPLPLDTPDAPGFFSPVIHDEAYYIYSFTRTSSTVTQNVAKSLESFGLSAWLTLVASTLILEALIHCSSQFGDIKSLSLEQSFRPKRMSTYIIGEVLVNFGATLFSQYLPNRSILRLTQVLSIMFLTMILLASFSTSTIAGDEEKKIETLRDVVEQDKKPYFIEGESLAELFQKGVTRDYADVYKLALAKGTSNLVTMSTLEFFENLAYDMVYFNSNELARSLEACAKALDKTILQDHHKSAKPYHRASTALLSNPAYNVDDIKHRMNVLSIRQIQGALFIVSLRLIINEFLASSFLPITASQMILASYNFADEPRNFAPLKLQGCRVLFIVWATLIGIAVILFFFEMLFGRL